MTGISGLKSQSEVLRERWQRYLALSATSWSHHDLLHTGFGCGPVSLYTSNKGTARRFGSRSQQEEGVASYSLNLGSYWLSGIVLVNLRPSPLYLINNQGSCVRHQGVVDCGDSFGCVRKGRGAVALLRTCKTVAEDIRSRFTNVNYIVFTVKIMLLKAPSRILSFKAALPNTLLPPQPVLTRWGTSLHASLYYADHLGDIQKVVQTFDEEQAVAITEANAAISCSRVSADLAYVKSHFGNLPGAITALEVRYLPLMKAVKIMRGIEENLNQA
ncbi:unnamed protein product, partial [Timema podura]|nr:unnamed protein product [Timema podura]